MPITAAPGSAPSPGDVFAAAIDLLDSELIPQASAKRKRLYGKVIRVLATLQRKAQRYAHETSPTGSDSEPEAGLGLRAWGLILRRRREAASLTRAQLAVLADVADSTIRNIETGRHAPTRSVVLRLQGVSALRLPGLLAQPSSSVGPVPASSVLQGHCWLSPDCNAIEQSRELSRILRGKGGRLEPALLFLDPASAAAWCAFSSTGEQLQERASMPIAAAAHAISQHMSGASMDVLGLGAGEAHGEIALSQALCTSDIASLRLILLDSSPPLLTIGFQNACRALAVQPRVSCFSVQGDMRNLPSYAPLQTATRRRLACLLGDTFSTLDNEATLARHGLGSLCGGDLLLLDVPITLPEPRDEPHLRPEAFTQPEATPLVEFLTGPLHRHSTEVRSVELSAVLDSSACTVPGSYAVEYQATVCTANRQPRRFSLYHVKRYDPGRLIGCLTLMGWELVERWPFGNEHRPRALLLLHKRA